jgi:hypothetical protein
MRNPVSKLKGANLTHPHPGTAKRLSKQYAKPRPRGGWLLGLWKFAVSDESGSQSYANWYCLKVTSSFSLTLRLSSFLKNFQAFF